MRGAISGAVAESPTKIPFFHRMSLELTTNKRMWRLYYQHILFCVWLQNKTKFPARLCCFSRLQGKTLTCLLYIFKGAQIIQLKEINEKVNLQLSSNFAAIY